MKPADELVDRFTLKHAKVSLGFDSKGNHREGMGTLNKFDAIELAIISLEETVKALNEELPWSDLSGNIQANHFLNESGNLIRKYQQQIEYLKGKL